MLFSDEVELVALSWGENDYGHPVQIEVRRLVFANKRSVRQSEHYQAAIAGLRPELMFEVWTAEYEGETRLIYAGTEYQIGRTYARTDEKTELIVTGLVND